LSQNGRVAFVDDAYRAPDELIDAEYSSIIQRRLTDGLDLAVGVESRRLQ
jgi:demethylmenaquinone methyltransferase/2-methoxy-6-polyprenyl-1,4-benzoquinol methylase